jgi:hypothetical protein
MSVHSYPPAAAFADFARAGAGLLLAAVPLVLADTIPVVTVILAILVIVFAVYALRTASRQFTRVEIDEDGVRARGPTTHTVPWRTLRRVKLSYYSTRRDRTGGWLQLTIAGDAETLTVDSRIAGFESLAERAIIAARKKGLKLDPTTLYNFQSLGLSTNEVEGMEAVENRR